MDEPAASTDPSGAGLVHQGRVRDPAHPERRDVFSERQPRSRYQPVWWALAFSAVTTVGLGALAWGILIADVLSYGVAAVITQETIAAPEEGRYCLAFAVGVIVNLGTASALAWLTCQTPGRTWPPAVQGLTAALFAAVAAGCALLLTLGIDPVGFARPVVHPGRPSPT